MKWRLVKQGVALTGRNTTGPSSPAAPKIYVAYASVTDDDRRQRPLLVWPCYTMCRRVSNKSISDIRLLSCRLARIQSPHQLWYVCRWFCVVVCTVVGRLMYIFSLIRMWMKTGWCYICHFTKTAFLGRLLRVDLIKWVSNVRLSVCLSIHKKLIWFQWNLVCR